MLSVVPAAVVGYLVGSVPVAVVVGRRHGIDPRRAGDRNPGYWNVKELLGGRLALPVLLGDAAKGAVAGAAGLLAAGDDWVVAYVAVAAAMLGHAFPVFAGFAGGRSILTFAGGVVVLAPVPASLAVLGCVVVSVLTRFAVGARVAVFGFPLVQAAFDPIERVAATGALMTIIGIRFATAAWRAPRHRAG